VQARGGIEIDLAVTTFTCKPNVTHLQFDINCTSIYQGDADSALTLFNRYLFIC